MRFREFLLRPATNSDIPAIKKLVFSSLIEHGLRPDETGKDKDLDDIEKNYSSNNGFFGVAIYEETNQIVGTFGIHPMAQKICELRKMYLSKEVRGQGLGRWLLERTVAISLYKKFGFKEVKPREINERVDQAFELYIQ